jgi:hypothetical protein
MRSEIKNDKNWKRKVVAISPRPRGRNLGKNGDKILCQNETRAANAYEKIKWPFGK